MSIDLGENGPEWRVSYLVKVVVNAADEIEAQQLADYDIQHALRDRPSNVDEGTFYSAEPQP